MVEAFESTKLCPRCNEEKPLGQFYSDSSKAGGFKSHCKKCFRATVSRYKRTPGGKSAIKSYANRNREKLLARWHVRYRVMTGVIPPATDCECSRCGGMAKEYHHHNGYSKEHNTDVIPLCVPCHARAHSMEN